jgi:hypothetical protein
MMAVDRFPPSAADSYIRRLNNVHGWLDRFSADVILATARFQHELGHSGNVAEIGVHHGKLFFVLYLSIAENEQAVAVDIFGRQHLNLDNSGCGDKTIFLRHAARLAPQLPGLKIIEESSLHVTPRALLSHGGRIRLFSIDGGHTEEATLNDLHLAESTLTEEGVVIIDDYFNAGWPEVSVATARYLLDGAGALVPYAISPNKIYLCRPTMRPVYADMLATRFRPRFEKRVRFFGHETLLLGVTPLTWKRRIARTALGRRLRRYLSSGAFACGGPSVARTTSQVRPASRQR